MIKIRMNLPNAISIGFVVINALFVLSQVIDNLIGNDRLPSFVLIPGLIIFGIEILFSIICLIFLLPFLIRILFYRNRYNIKELVIATVCCFVQFVGMLIVRYNF
jgi:hypothetical protein